MQSKLKFFFLSLAAASITFFSCSKNNSAPVTPPVPEVVDSLGMGWQRIKIDSTIDFEDIFFVNNQVGFLCGNKYLGKSTDGGLTWKKVIPDSLNQNFTNLFFLDANTGWATGGAFLVRTGDGGASWQRVYTGNTFDVQFFDASNGYISTQAGLFKTTNGGSTLQLLKAAGAGARGLFFLNQNKGWFCADYLYKTDNAAQVFSQTVPFGVSGEYAIQFTDSLHGWMAGGGPVLKTADGGATAEGVIMDGVINTPGLGDINFFDNNNGFILNNGRIYSTADGGKTLNIQCRILKSKIPEIHFTDPAHGWATGSGGYVYRYVKP